MKWFTYTRGTIPLYRIAPVFKGVLRLSEKPQKTFFARTLYVNIGPKLWWAWDSKELKKIADYLIKAAAKKITAEKIFRGYEKYGRRALEAVEKIRKTDLSKLSNRQIRELYDYLEENAAEAQGLLGLYIDAIDAYFEDFLIEKIRLERPDFDNEKIKNVYGEISVSPYSTYVSQQEKRLIEAALSRKSSDFLAGKIYEEFWWSNLGWESLEPRLVGYFKKQIEKLRRQKGLEKKLREDELRKEKIIRLRSSLIKKYGFSKEISYWLGIADRYAYFHDLRKESQAKMVYVINLLMREAAKRLKISLADMEWCWPQEVRDALGGKKLDLDEIRRRKKAVCVLAQKRKIWHWSGQEALKRFEKELGGKKDPLVLTEFKGMAVRGGLVRGRAKVCAGSAEALAKVKKGDILVCGMTVPDCVPAMKKAAAIVTDEGGITCHAAILSRELGVPCVVGTKIATQVLKDGDMVEVDAEKGIVKIIKNK